MRYGIIGESPVERLGLASGMVPTPLFEPYGAGFKKDDTAFAEFLNGVIADYKSSGAWQKSYDRWLGQYTGEQQSPPGQTLEDVLAAE